MAGELGLKSEFYLKDGAAFVKVGHVTGFEMFEYSRDAIDKTTLDSDAHEYFQGLLEAGEVPVDVIYVPGSATDMLCQEMVLAPSGTEQQAKIVISNAAGAAAWEIEMDGFVMNYNRGSIQPGEMKTAKLTWKISNKPTEAAA